MSHRLPSSISSFLNSAALAALILLCALAIPASAQNSNNIPPHSAQQKLKARDRYLLRGRTAPPGQSPAALRLKAYRQKIANRDAAAAGRVFAAQPGPIPQVGGPQWISLGPAPLISYQNIYGPVSGRVTSVALDPTDSTGNTLFAASATGGIWQSLNAATLPASAVTWAPLTDQQPSLVNGAISIKPDATVLLAGTGEPNNAIDSYYGVGILRSADHGATWNLISSADTGSHSFAGLGFSKFAWNAAAVVAAAGTTTQGFNDGDITRATALGLYYSPDAGQTWSFQTPQDAGISITPASATDVVYNAVAAKYFASIRFHGLYSSTNGQNWTRLANQPNPAQLSTSNCPAQIPQGGSACPIYRGQFAVVPGRNEMYFWFITLVSGEGEEGVTVLDQGLWRSLDAGNTWTQIDETGIANCGDPGNNGCGVDLGYYNLTLAALPSSTSTDLYAGADNLYKCTVASGAVDCSTIDPNLPNQWINLTHVYGCASIAAVHPNQHALDFLLTGGKAIMVFGTDGGLYRALNGYTGLNSGTCGSPNAFDSLNASSVPGATIGSLTEFVSFSPDAFDQNTILGGTDGNGSAATSSATTNPQWITVNGGDGGFTAINSDPHWPPAEWYTANSFANIYMCGSGIDCTTQTFAQTIDSQELNGDLGAFNTPFILDPQDNYQMLVGTCRVWSGVPTVPPTSLASLSYDFDTLGDDTCTGEEVNLVAGLDAGGPQEAGFISTTVYATTEGTGPNAASPYGGEVWITTNSGIAPMSQITGAINPSNYTISSVSVDQSDPSGATAYVGIMGFNVSHIFKTTNDGATWTDWSGSGSAALPDAPVNAVLVDTLSQQIYAATDVGVFASSTAAPTWIEVGVPPQPGGASGYLPNVPVTALRVFASDGLKKLRASTYGRGVWEYTLGPDFSVSVTATPTSTVAAQNVTWSGALTAWNGYTGTVNLACVDSPPNCSINPSTITPTPIGVATTATVGSSTAGSFTFGIQGTDGTTTHTQLVKLNVGTDVAWSNTGSSKVTVAAGQTATYQFSAAPVGASIFTGPVSFACPNLPALTTCSFSPTSLAAGAGTTAVTLTITTTGPNQGTEFRRRIASAAAHSSSTTSNLIEATKMGAAKTGAVKIGPTRIPPLPIISRAFAWLLAIPLAALALCGISRKKISANASPSPLPRAQFWSCLALAALLLMVACGGLSGSGGGGGGQPPPAVTVTVSPTIASLYINERGNTWPSSTTTQQFTATVNNGSSQTVTWSVGGTAANGSIDATGLYTAPATLPNPATATVTATSSEATSPATATINLKPATAIGVFSNLQATATAAYGPPHPATISLTVD